MSFCSNGILQSRMESHSLSSSLSTFLRLEPCISLLSGSIQLPLTVHYILAVGVHCTEKGVCIRIATHLNKVLINEDVQNVGKILTWLLTALQSVPWGSSSPHPFPKKIFHSPPSVSLVNTAGTAAVAWRLGWHSVSVATCCASNNMKHHNHTVRWHSKYHSLD